MTKLFDVLDEMEAVLLAVPALAGRVGVERTLPMVAEQLPQCTLVPRRGVPGGLDGETLARDHTVVLGVRAAGARPGRDAHALAAQAHAALTTAATLNAGDVTLRLSTETFRYLDAEQSLCDLQIEYEVTFEHARESLLGF